MRRFSITAHKIKGFTLIETLIGIVIAMLVVGAGVLGINKAIQNSKYDRTEMLLRTFVSDIEMYVTENGSPDKEEVAEGEETEDTDEIEVMAENFLKKFNAGYSSATFGELKVDGDSFTADATITKDAWGTNFRLYYSWSKDFFIIASAGPNAKFEFTTATDASELDDVMAVIVKKQQ